MKIDKPGIFTDFDEAAYFADPCPSPSLTQSIAKILIDQSPAHAKLAHPRLSSQTADKETYVRAKAIGNAAHKIMTGRGRELAIAKFDDFRTKEAKAFRDEQTAAGKLVVLVEDCDTAHKMVFAAHGQLEAHGMMHAFDTIHSPINGEVVIAAHADGIWLRSLVDWMHTTVELWDYKTTGMSVAPHAVPALMASAGWPIQAAMQERILDLIDPDNAGRRKFYFVAQENYEPYALTVHLMTEGTMTMGRKMLTHAESIWRACMEIGEWPLYPTIVHTPEFPAYAEAKWLTREVEHEERRQKGDFNPNILMAG
jgi:hypothetical protein